MTAAFDKGGKAFRLHPSVPVPMRDGVALSTDIWLPDEGSGAFPVLLQRTPYRKETPFGAQYINSFEIQAALSRGFAVAVQDTRGRYGSEGEFLPFETEARDGADTIAWLRDQPFCNGDVGMYGASYVGATQVLALAEDPQGLKAVIPQLTTARHGDTWMYRDGALELGFVFLWIIEALALDHLSHRTDLAADDAARAHALLAELQRDPLAAFDRLPLLSDEMLTLAPYLAQWLDPLRISGLGGDTSVDWAKTNRTPMLVIGGFNDIFVEGSIELYQHARSRWHEGETMPDRLILGPWSHGNPTDWQGDERLGYGASTSLLLEEQLRFFGDAMVGRVSATPPVRYFRSGSNSWHSAEQWPPPSNETIFFLDCATRSLQTSPAEPAVTNFAADPHNPIPTIGGATFLPGLLVGKNAGPFDQAGVEGRQDVVTFTSEPLAADLDVTGLVVVRLWVASSAPTCDWTAKLCDVDPEGISRSIVDGILRWGASDRADGEASEIEIRLGHASRLFRKGHRIRLQVASSNFPRFDRNPQSGAASTLATSSDFRIAYQNIFSGYGQASRLVLPVVKA